MQKKGQDVSPIQRLMQKIGPLLQEGKTEEAGKLIDEALKITEENAGREPTESSRGPAKGKRTTRAALERLSPAEVGDQVGALKQHDVAWRKIKWKTCLLDGLRASREQRKPIMLWIFIDRPIDDERC
jgi:hypothetical protein